MSAGSLRVQTENHHMRIRFVLQPEELFMNHVPCRSVFLLSCVALEFMTRCKLGIGDRLGIKSNTFFPFCKKKNKGFRVETRQVRLFTVISLLSF
jgi:hypothetical protein